MLTVKTILDNSTLGGVGIFSKEFISKGQMVWQNGTDSDITITQDEFDKKSDYVKGLFRKYDYKDNHWYLPLDDSRFMNHSNDPNLREDEHGNYVATKDIYEYDELTCDYWEFDNGEGCGNFLKQPH